MQDTLRIISYPRALLPGLAKSDKQDTFARAHSSKGYAAARPIVCKIPLLAHALGLKARSSARDNRVSSIYMRASYEELRKIGKNCEKVGKSDKK